MLQAEIGQNRRDWLLLAGRGSGRLARFGQSKQSRRSGRRSPAHARPSGRKPSLIAPSSESVRPRAGRPSQCLPTRIRPSATPPAFHQNRRRQTASRLPRTSWTITRRKGFDVKSPDAPDDVDRVSRRAALSRVRPEVRPRGAADLPGASIRGPTTGWCSLIFATSRRSSLAVTKNARTLAHEATHQLTFNTGLFNRAGDVPLATRRGARLL